MEIISVRGLKRDPVSGDYGFVARASGISEVDTLRVYTRKPGQARYDVAMVTPRVRECPRDPDKRLCMTFRLKDLPDDTRVYVKITRLGGSVKSNKVKLDPYA